MSSATADDHVVLNKEKLQQTLFKLLDKAGRDKRLTLKVLRKKTEERLKVDDGTLDAKRDLIKKYIMKWWSTQPEAIEAAAKEEKIKEKEKEKEKEKTKEKEKEKAADTVEHALSRLTKLAKAAGKGPTFWQPFKDLEGNAKVRAIRSKLREEGLKFSDVPSSEEIQAIQKETEKKKDLDSVDPSLIINSKRKSSSSADSGAPSTKKAATESASRKQKLQYNSSDEEADF